MKRSKLWNKDFKLLWLGHSQSGIGNTLYIVALSYLVLEVTNSPKYTAFAISAAAFPYIFSPLAGAIVDRINLKPLLIVGDLVRGGIMLSVVFLAHLNMLSPWALIILSVLLGGTGMFYGPAFAVLLPNLVPKSDISRANALNSLSGQISSLLGFAIGGILVGLIGTKIAITLNAISFIIMAILLSYIKFPHRTPNTSQKHILKETLEGIKFVKSNRIVFMVPIIFSIISVSYIPLQILMPLKLKQVSLGPDSYGQFFTLLCVGSILSSLILSRFKNKVSLKIGITLGLFFLSLAALGIGLSNSFAIICILGILFGISRSFISLNLLSFVQTNVNPNFRGRMFGLFGTIENIGMPLVISGIGILTDYISVSSILLLNPLIVLCTAFAWYLNSTKHTYETDQKDMEMKLAIKAYK